MAFVSRLAFWLITDRVWEDALITVTHARNAVLGIGLTHHPGEPPTHGFAKYVVVETISAPAGTIQTDPEGRRRISFLGLTTDSSNSEPIVLRRTTG